MTDQERPVNLVLLGRTGNGKSSTGNTLIGQNCFKVNFLGGVIDGRCERFKAAIQDGPIINVVDTPGLLDLSDSEDNISKEIINCLTMMEEGIHAVLFVLSVTNRISQREESTLNTLQHIFGDKILDYFIVVFTGGDYLEADNQTLDDYLREGCPDFLTRVLKLCGGRKVLFNNKTKDEAKRTKQLNELLAHVTAIGKQNSGIPYTDKMHRNMKVENDSLGGKETETEAKNLPEAGLEVIKEKLRMENDQTMNIMTHPLKNAFATNEREIKHDQATNMMIQPLSNDLKQSAATHEREMRQLQDTLQLNDTPTMKMMEQMVENALKQNAMAQERERCQLRDTQTMRMMENIVENALKQNAMAHEIEMRQLKDTLQLKHTQTMNMMEQMMENKLTQMAMASETEMNKLNDILQHGKPQLSSPGKGMTCQCNIM